MLKMPEYLSNYDISQLVFFVHMDDRQMFLVCAPMKVKI